MLLSLGVVSGALVSGTGRWCSRQWERSLVLLLLVGFAGAPIAGSDIGALIAGSGRCFSCQWERSLVISSLGAFDGAIVAGSGRRCYRHWERSLVAFFGSGCWWILSEAVFGALVGSNPEMVIELS